MEKIFTKFLKKHPLIPDYRNCHFKEEPWGNVGTVSTIACSSGSYTVTAIRENFNLTSHNNGFSIKVGMDGKEKEFDGCTCNINGCTAASLDKPLHYSFKYHPHDGKCLEALNPDGDGGQNVPCDGDVTLFDDYLKQSTITLETPQPLPPPNSQNAQSGNASGNSSSRNTTSLRTVLGAACTVLLSYKAYKERGKMDEEGRRAEATPRQNGQAANPDKKSSGHRALGYVVVAIAAGAFTLYSIRP